MTLLLPENTMLSELSKIIDDINEACLEEGVQVAGGHTEVTPGLLQPIISVAALGKTRGRRFLSSAGAKVGDDIVVTKWAGMEGTSILVRDFKEAVSYTHLDVYKRQDFVKRVKIDKDILRNLILCGAFDEFEVSRRMLLWQSNDLKPSNHDENQISLLEPIYDKCSRCV